MGRRRMFKELHSTYGILKCKGLREELTVRIQFNTHQQPMREVLASSIFPLSKSPMTAPVRGSVKNANNNEFFRTPGLYSQLHHFCYYGVNLNKSLPYLNTEFLVGRIWLISPDYLTRLLRFTCKVICWHTG